MPNVNDYNWTDPATGQPSATPGVGNPTPITPPPPVAAPVSPATGNLPNTPAPANGPALAAAVDASGQTPFEAGTGISGYDAALAAENTPTNTDPNAWMEDWMKSAFGAGDAPATNNNITAPTFDAEKARLEASKNSQLQAIDAQYATDLATMQKNNKNVGNSLKARLLKLGVSPSDSAWSNAEAGQLERDTSAEAGLRSEYMSNKAKVEANMADKITNIVMQEATMNFNASVQNIQTKLQTQAQGINLFEIFSQRAQDQKDMEQRAYSDLMTYKGTMAGIEQRQQEAIAKNFWDNAKNGAYNISDESTLKGLSELEKSSPYLQGLTAAASAGLTDRLDKMAQSAATLEKTKADIAQSYASINKMRSDAASSGNKEQQKFFDDAAIQLDKLSSGETDWATAYDSMMEEYKIDPNSSPEAKEDYRIQQNLLDKLLNKNVWSTPGAYEYIQQQRKGSAGTSITTADGTVIQLN